jgi:RimJ/RimL family protein N-acetyltransferase
LLSWQKGGKSVHMERTENLGGEWQVVDQQREQMLRLVTRGFFNELVNYGVKREELLRVATHLLDNVLSQQEGGGQSRPDSGSRLSLPSVQDHWKDEQRLTVDRVTLRPLGRNLVPRLSEWLRAPGANESFLPPFPSGEEALALHFFGSTARDYLTIDVAGEPVGIIGGESLDRASGRMEMRKLVGEPALRGQGIGKRATFGFLYYAFSILGLHKVYIHSRDINVRNMNLNSSFGFELEGVFLEELAAPNGRRADVVRMALLKPIWLAMFAA